MIVTTAAEMRRIDALAIERFRVPATTLMEAAGQGAAEALLARFPHVRRAGVLVLVGKGNNGGDGFVLARALKRRRVRCDVVLAAPARDVRGAARAKMLAWQRAGGRVSRVTAGAMGPLARGLARAGCVVDGLFGTGLKGEITGLPAEVITLVNTSGLPCVALDIPSGLDADSGEPLGVAIQAELTVAFAAPKLGTVLFPGARYTGELVVVDIGIPDAAVRAVAPRARLMTPEHASVLLRPRDREAHKGSHGHLAIIAGGRGKTGAAALAARAAARTGAGLVTVGCPASVQPAVAAHLLEEMTWPLPDDGDGSLAFRSTTDFAAHLDGKTAVLAGPGIGVSPEREALIRWLATDAGVPLVLDADGLNCLAAADPDHVGHGAGPGLVLTPHPGEMARLAGITTGEVQRDRLGTAARVARERGAVVVLKGVRTVTATPDGQLWINPTGNPGLASGGTGDVLAGMAGSLLAQGYPPDEAARLAVYVHGAAADRIARRQGTIGLIASDLLPEIPRVLAGLAAADHAW